MGALMDRFKLGGPLKLQHFIHFIFGLVHLGPSRKIVEQIRGFLVLGRGYLGNLKTSAPPPPGQILAR